MRAQRDWPALEPLLFGGALVAYAAGLPLGLAPAAAAGTVAQGWALGGEVAGAPLALLGIRLLAYLPIGDLATRANLASAIAGAVAVALLGRLGLEALRLLRSPSEARRGPGAVSFEPAAAAGAAAVMGLSLGAFGAATGAGSGAATLALAAAAWLCMVELLRAPDDARAGTRMALLAGVASVEPVLVPLLWIPALILWFRALRRGARWPMVAPLLFTAGLGAVLFVVASSDSPPRLGELLARLWPSGGWQTIAVRAASIEAGEQLGVVGVLLGGLGLGVLATRAPLVLALVLWMMGAGLWLAGEAVRLSAAVAAVPLAVGIAHLAGKLGRARLAAAAALAVMAAVSPALDGGGARWARDVRLPARLLGRALGDVPLRARVNPGTPEMSGLFHYAAALGLRPDITVERR